MAPRPAVKISVPDADMDRPASRRLAVIAAVCFLCGVFWPSLAKLDFVQRPPGTPQPKPDESEPPPSETETDPARSPGPASSPGANSELLVPAARAELQHTQAETTVIEATLITSCHDAGQRAQSCDEPRLSGVTRAPIGELARCEGADGASGVLSLGLEVDFAQGRISRVKAGKSTTLSEELTASLVTCAEKSLTGISLAGIAHEHASYWLYHLVRFKPPGSPFDATSVPAGEIVSASGRGTIGWKTALVREAASRQAKTVARLLYGTRVNVTGRAGEWYRIDYDGRGSVGWVHRKAIGL